MNRLLSALLFLVGSTLSVRVIPNPAKGFDAGVEHTVSTTTKNPLKTSSTLAKTATAAPTTSAPTTSAVETDESVLLRNRVMNGNWVEDKSIVNVRTVSLNDVGDVWAVTEDKKKKNMVYTKSFSKLKKANKWVQVPGSLLQVDSGSVLVAGVDANHYIYRCSAETLKCTQVPGTAKHVSVGSDKIMFTIGDDGSITKYASSNSKPQLMPLSMEVKNNKASLISAANSHSIWVLDVEDNVYSCFPSSFNMNCRMIDDIKLRQITVSGDGEQVRVIGVDKEGSIWIWDPTNQQFLKAHPAIVGTATWVTISSSWVAVANDKGKLFFLDITGKK